MTVMGLENAPWILGRSPLHGESPLYKRKQRRCQRLFLTQKNSRRAVIEGIRLYKELRQAWFTYPGYVCRRS